MEKSSNEKQQPKDQVKATRRGQCRVNNSEGTKIMEIAQEDSDYGK